MSYHYLLDLVLILLSTKLLGIATGKFQMPRVVGALLAGLILGPAALCGVLVPMFMGTGFGWLAGRMGWLLENTFLENIFLGTVLTATSVSITVETLKELGHLDTKAGSAQSEPARLVF